jgi:hypothetical protein
MAEIEQCTNEDCELFERPTPSEGDDVDGHLGICPACGVTREYL